MQTSNFGIIFLKNIVEIYCARVLKKSNRYYFASKVTCLWEAMAIHVAAVPLLPHYWTCGEAHGLDDEALHAGLCEIMLQLDLAQRIAAVAQFLAC